MHQSEKLIAHLLFILFNAMIFPSTFMKGSWCIVALSTLAINTRVTTAFFAPFVSKQSATRLFSATAVNDEVGDLIVNNNENLSTLFPSLAVPLEKLGFSTPTPIQSASATRALSSENLLLIAPTGSGKTLAYLLPALQKAVTTGSTVLVVAPTRELSVQLMRDATSILSNLNEDEDNDEEEDMEVLLAVKGVDIPSTDMLNKATVLIGTPPEVVQVLTQVQGGLEFIAGDVLSSVILDEVDILLPNAPKRLRTALDGTDKDRKKKGNFKKSNTPQDERRRQEQKRKLNAAKRNGVEMSSSNKQIVGPTDTILKLIASRYSAGGDAVAPYQVIAGSATASRRTLDRLNKALYDAATEASATVEVVWTGNVKSCRPDVSIGEDSAENATDGDDAGEQHTIRAVTVPQQVKHQYIAMSKDSASSPMAVLSAVAKAAKALKPQSALVFLCGDFGKSVMTKKAQPVKAVRVPSGRTQKNTQARKKASLKNKKLAAAAASRAKNTPAGVSARQVCSTLVKLGVDAMPLHVALGLELNAKDDDEDAEIPPFLVTFEGSARGLHIDNVDTVFLVGRPASAASYLHLAGRVGRASTTADGSVAICPGTVVSLCTKGSAKELTKWTKQIGGTDLEELIL